MVGIPAFFMQTVTWVFNENIQDNQYIYYTPILFFLKKSLSEVYL